MDGFNKDLLAEMEKITGKKVNLPAVETPAPKTKGLDVPSIVDDELRKLGYNGNARLALVANLGRENSWNPNIIFGGHSDPYNKEYNRGIISWQKDRRTNLDNYIKQNGGDFTPNENNIRLQTRFLDNELQGRFGHIGRKIKNPNLSLEEAYPLLQKYILYRPEYESDNKKWEAKARQRGFGGQEPAEQMSEPYEFDKNLLAEMQAITGQTEQPYQFNADLLNQMNAITGANNYAIDPAENLAQTKANLEAQFKTSTSLKEKRQIRDAINKLDESIKAVSQQPPTSANIPQSDEQIAPHQSADIGKELPPTGSVSPNLAGKLDQPFTGQDPALPRRFDTLTPRGFEAEDEITLSNGEKIKLVRDKTGLQFNEFKYKTSDGTELIMTVGHPDETGRYGMQFKEANPKPEQAEIRRQYKEWLELSGLQDNKQSIDEFNRLMKLSVEGANAQNKRDVDEYNRNLPKRTVANNAPTQPIQNVQPTSANNAQVANESASFRIDLKKGDDARRKLKNASIDYLVSNYGISGEDAERALGNSPLMSDKGRVTDTDLQSIADRNGYIEQTLEPSVLKAAQYYKTRRLEFEQKQANVKERVAKGESELDAKLQEGIITPEQYNTAQYELKQKEEKAAETERQKREQLLDESERYLYGESGGTANERMLKSAQATQMNDSPEKRLDDILSRYGSATQYYKEQDAQRETWQKIASNPNAVVKEVASNFLKIFPQALSASYKGIAIGSELLDKGIQAGAEKGLLGIGGDWYARNQTQNTPAIERASFQFAQSVDRWAEEMFPEDPVLKRNFIIRVIPNTIGQVLVQIGLGAASGGATVPLLFAGAMGASSGYEDATQKSADNNTRLKMASLSALTAVMADGLPISKFLAPLTASQKGNFINRTLNAVFAQTAKEVGEKEAVDLTRRFASNILKGGALESVPGLIDKKVTDYYASLTYDKKRKVWQIDGEDIETLFAGFVGGGVGGTVETTAEISNEALMPETEFKQKLAEEYKKRIIEPVNENAPTEPVTEKPQPAFEVRRDARLRELGYADSEITAMTGAEKQEIIDLKSAEQPVQAKSEDVQTVADKADVKENLTTDKTPDISTQVSENLPEKVDVPVSENEGKQEKQPYEMAKADWENAVSENKPNYAQSKPTKNDGSIATRRLNALQVLNYGVRNEAQQKLREYNQAIKENRKPNISDEEARDLIEQVNYPVTHRQVIEKALSEGKTVPLEVLADYPDLAKKYEKLNETQTEIQEPTAPVPPSALAEDKPAQDTSAVQKKLDRATAEKRASKWFDVSNKSESAQNVLKTAQSKPIEIDRVEKAKSQSLQLPQTVNENFDSPKNKLVPIETKTFAVNDIPDTSVKRAAMMSQKTGKPYFYDFNTGKSYEFGRYVHPFNDNTNKTFGYVAVKDGKASITQYKLGEEVKTGKPASTVQRVKVAPVENVVEKPKQPSIKQRQQEIVYQQARKDVNAYRDKMIDKYGESWVDRLSSHEAETWKELTATERQAAVGKPTQLTKGDTVTLKGKQRKVTKVAKDGKKIVLDGGAIVDAGKVEKVNVKETEKITYDNDNIGKKTEKSNTLPSTPKEQNFETFAKERGYPDDYDTMFQAQLLGGRGLEGKRQSNRSINQEDKAFSEMQSRKDKGKEEYRKEILSGNIIDPSGAITREKLLRQDFDFESKKLESEIANAKTGIKRVEGFGSMSHLPNGKLKKGYQRTVDDYNDRIAKAQNKLDELKAEFERQTKTDNPLLKASDVEGFDSAEDSILLKQRDPQSTALAKSLLKNTQLEDTAKITAKTSELGIEVNEQGAEFIRRAMVSAGYKVKQFDGAFNNPKQTKDIISELKDLRDVVEGLDGDVSAVDNLINQLKSYAENNQGVATVYLYDDAIPHEKVHERMFVNALDKHNERMFGNSDGLKDATFSKAKKTLDKISGRKLSDGETLQEMVAYIASGEYDKIGLDIDEAVAWIERALDAYVATNGEQVLSDIKSFADRQTGIYETIEKFQNKISEAEQGLDRTDGSLQGEPEGQDGSTQETSVSEERTEEERNAEITGETVKQIKTKNRQFAVSIANSFYDIGDVEYEAQSEQKWLKQSQKDIDSLGVDGAIEKYDSLDAKTSEGYKTALGVAIASELYANGDRKQFTDFGRKLTQDIGNIAQELRATQLLARLSPEHAVMAGIAKREKALGRKLTDEEEAQLTQVLGQTAEQLKEVSDNLDSANAMIDEHRIQIAQYERLQAEMRDLLAQEEVKAKNLSKDLSIAKRLATFYKNLFEGNRTKSGKRNQKVSAIRKEVEANPEILKRIRERFKSNPLLSVRFDQWNYSKNAENAIDLRKHEEFGKLLFQNDPNPKEVAKFNKWLKANPNQVIKMYHGTNPNLPILEQGLKKTTASRRNSYQSESGYVYLSLYPTSANDFGAIGHGRNDSKVYEVLVPIGILKPDNDQLRNVRVFGEQEVGSTLADSLIHGSGARTPINLDSYFISRYGVFEGGRLIEQNNNPFGRTWMVEDTSPLLKASDLDSATFDDLTKLSVAKLDKELANGFTPEQFDKWLDVVTSNELTDYQKNVIHAEAWDIITGEPKAVTAEQKAIQKNRLAHAKRANAILKANEVKAKEDLAKALRDNTAFRNDKYAKEIVSVANGVSASPEAVTIAFGIREVGETRYLRELFAELYPDASKADFSKALIEARNLLELTKENHRRILTELRNGGTLTDQAYQSLLLEKRDAEKLQRKKKQELERILKELEYSNAKKMLLFLEKLYNIPRSLGFSTDAGFLGRQGGKAFLTNNKAWREASKVIRPEQAAKDALRDGDWQAFVKNFAPALTNGERLDNILHDLYKSDIRRLAEARGAKFKEIGEASYAYEDWANSLFEEGFDAKETDNALMKATKKFINGVTFLPRRSNRAHGAFLDVLRLKIFEDAYEKLQKMNLDEKNRVASEEFFAKKFAPVMTGQGYGGNYDNVLNWASRIPLASARLRLSHFQFLYYMNPVRAAFLPKGARKIVFEKQAKFYAPVFTFIALAMLAGAMGDDPEESDFLKIKGDWLADKTGFEGFRDMRIDLSGGAKEAWRTTVLGAERLVYGITGNKQKSASIDKELFSMYVTRQYKHNKTGEWKTGVGSFWRYGAHPSLSIGTSLWDGQDAIGQPYDKWKAARDFVLPLPSREAYESGTYKHDKAKSDTAVRLFTTFALNQIGAGVNSYRTVKNSNPELDAIEAEIKKAREAKDTKKVNELIKKKVELRKKK